MLVINFKVWTYLICVSVSLEAAIGIEPMNKGFAVRPGPLLPSVMECHRRVNIGSL